MKKRSLIAALAMLIVSAVVLTSATYAWFASGTNAYVTQISGTVTNSDGSVLLSADGGTTWLSTIGQGNFTQSTGSFASAFAPVSVTPSASATAVQGGALDGSNFSMAAATAGTEYTQFTFKVKTTNGATVTCTPNFSSAVTYGYALVIVDGTVYVYGTSNHSYYPVTKNDNLNDSTADGVDSNNNYYMDNGDSTCPALGNIVSVDNTATISIPTTANTPKDIVVYLWVEGQDSACNGSVNQQEVGIAFTFTK